MHAHGRTGHGAHDVHLLVINFAIELLGIEGYCAKSAAKLALMLMSLLSAGNARAVDDTCTSYSSLRP